MAQSKVALDMPSPQFAATHQYAASIQMLGVPDRFIEQGTVAELQQICGLDVGSIQSLLEKYL